MKVLEMTVSVVASALAKSQYSFTDSETSTIRSDNETVLSNCAYTYGTGNFEIDVGVKQTGTLPSGGSVTIDLTSMSKEFMDYTATVRFSGVKNLCISNASTVEGRDISVRATGSNAFTSMFNGGSGNMLVKPYSSYVYNDPYGTRTSSTKKTLTLFDVSGSGASYVIGVLGNLS